MMRPPVSPATIDIGFLEPVLQRLAAAIGLELTLRLVEQCGGVPTYFPKDLAPHHWLVELLGREAARSAIEVLGPGEHHTLPRGLVALRVARNRQMRKDRETMSVRSIAKRYGMSRRGVQLLFARDEQRSCGQVAAIQDDLFPA